VQWFRTKVLRRGDDTEENERLERLRSSKAAVSRQIDDRRAAQRFEPESDEDSPAEQRELEDAVRDAGGSASPGGPPRPVAGRPIQPADVEEEEDYTARLLAAKRKAMEERKRKS
jgi:hypothetical protein